MLYSPHLYARTTAFIQTALAEPAVAAGAKRVSAVLIGYFVHVFEFESWCTFRAALGVNGSQDVSTKVMTWQHTALHEHDKAAAWGYEIIAINLAATAAAANDPNAAIVLQLTDSILRCALANICSLLDEPSLDGKTRGSSHNTLPIAPF